MDDTKGVWVWPMTEFQLKYLESMIKQDYGDIPMTIKVKKVAMTSTGDLIIQYLQYERLQTIKISNTQTNGNFNPNNTIIFKD